MNDIRRKLILAGVRNLKEFGYPAVTPENILTDLIYKSFFSSMLGESIGHSNSIDTEIKLLLKEVV